MIKVKNNRDIIYKINIGIEWQYTTDIVTVQVTVKENINNELEKHITELC